MEGGWGEGEGDNNNNSYTAPCPVRGVGGRRMGVLCMDSSTLSELSLNEFSHLK